MLEPNPWEQPIPGQPDVHGLFDRACELLDTAVTSLRNAYNALVNKIKQAGFAFGIAGVLLIKKAMEKINEIVGKGLALAKYVVDHYLPVVSLIVQSFNWVNQVKNPMSELAAPAGGPLPGNDNFGIWSGHAADAYKRKATDQKAAITEYVGRAEFISKWLFTIAQTNVSYVADLAAGVAKIASQIFTTTEEGLTVVMLPWAVDRLGDALNTVIEESMKALIQYGKNFVAAIGNIRDSVSEQNDHTIFTGGSWPQAVVN